MRARKTIAVIIKTRKSGGRLSVNRGEKAPHISHMRRD